MEYNKKVEAMDGLGKTMQRGVRLSAQDWRDLQKAARSYSKRVGRRVPPLTYLREFGLKAARRENRRTVKPSPELAGAL